MSEQQEAIVRSQALLMFARNQGKTKIIERLIDTKFDFRTSYEVKTVSIV